ncbi:Tyrosine-protein kinase transmembrane receptor Ror2 [Sarcoptes scabiei]|nr:Tyrosine-protein kinase transmembrane receptor Ror2 [Sarcoptes scabiei]
MASNTNVCVALRIRPKLQREEIDMCNICTRVTPGEPQIFLGHDKAFTFDHVFDMISKQSDVYESCVKTLIEGCFDGFNATVLAYGQTGSGKTYTMGTGFDISYPEHQRGIIPRAVEHLFNGIRSRQEFARKEGREVPEFTVTAQFIEIYNEELIDLLAEKRNKNNIRIHEDLKKGITLVGVESRLVTSAEETLQCLKSGSLFRTTGATLMNSESSRSHAIFTLFIKQSRVDIIKNHDSEDQCDVNVNMNVIDKEVVTLTAKFNFVDLAGSERLSRTGAVGERAREGISINSGLLHLGNVISALGDRSKKITHVPYRDSKLTRVLQDSLGGNSVTTMIACISPCDRDFVETLNTLRYANRAKNIKNKIVANQDSQTQLINDLRRQLQQLQLENQELRQGKLFVKNDGEVELNDVYHENTMLQRELNNAQIRIKALNTRLENVNDENVILKERIAKFSINDHLNDGGNNAEDFTESLIKGYLKEINNLRSKVVENEHTITYYRRQLNLQEMGSDDGGFSSNFIEKTKHEIEMGKSFYQQLNNSLNSADTNGNRLSDELDEENDDYSNSDEEPEELEKKIANHKAELSDIIENLAAKERMIEEFEAKERHIHEMTEKYEQRIASFKMKIKQVEEERDTLLNKIKKESKEDHVFKAKKEEYEKKLAALQNEVRRFERLKREHQSTLNKLKLSTEQMKKSRQEALEAKKAHVKLITKMKEQMNMHNKEMQKNRLMINKLTREDYKKVVKIRDLEVQSNQQKKMLQRKDEEIKTLKRMVKPMSDRVAGRFHKRHINGSTPQKARNKWHVFEAKFNKIVAQRMLFETEEKKLERFLQERQKCIDLLNTMKESPTIDDDNLENLQTNIDYLSKCIEDTQNVIMQLEDENINIEQLFNTLDSDEVIYVMDKLANSAINYAIIASQHEEELKEKTANLNDLANENNLQTQLLNYMVSNVQLKHRDDDEELYAAIPDTKTSTDKFRRLTMTPSDLLKADFGTKNDSRNKKNYDDKITTIPEITKTSFNDNLNKSMIIEPFENDNIELESDKESDLNSTYCVEKSSKPTSSTTSNGPMNDSIIDDHISKSDFQNSIIESKLPRLNGTQDLQFNSLANASSLNDYNTPPGSPSVNRRSQNRDTSSSALITSINENDVFSRLANTASNQIETSTGKILANSMKTDKLFPLTCTHTVVGHRRPVLSVTATNEVLFSGSKDGTAKIWDLSQCTEVSSLSDHLDAVNVVRYDEYNRLIYTCSKSIIKIWDPRQNPEIVCVRTLCSSGLMLDNTSNESIICDMRLSADGLTLFSTTERLVRVWDIRTFQSIGKLNTGHKSLVTCLAVDDDEINDTRLVITGSKDHTVKVFELDSNMSGIHIPKYTLKPPHYDGIEALRLTDKGQTLFSCGRDGCIKKWSLTEQRCLASLGNCHRDWVLALDTFLQGSVLLSACRSGYLRVWSTENCRLFGEIQAHSSAINDIATIPQAVFTASNDCTINLWQYRDSNTIDDIDQ